MPRKVGEVTGESRRESDTRPSENSAWLPSSVSGLFTWGLALADCVCSCTSYWHHPTPNWAICHLARDPSASCRCVFSVHWNCKLLESRLVFLFYPSLLCPNQKFDIYYINYKQMKNYEKASALMYLGYWWVTLIWGPIMFSFPECGQKHRSYWQYNWGMLFAPGGFATKSK